MAALRRNRKELDVVRNIFGKALAEAAGSSNNGIKKSTAETAAASSR